MVHDIHDGLRLVIETRDRRRDDCAHFRHRRHRPKVAEMKRSLANHQDQLASFLQCDIGRADQ